MHDEHKKWIYWAIPIVVVLAIGVALYYGRMREAADEQTAEAPAGPAASIAPPVQYPLETPGEQTAPLPTLNDSDAPVVDSLTGVFGRALEPYLVTKDVIRNAVVTIDNLPRKKTAVQRWPVKQTAGEFATSGAADVTLSEENFKRYAPLIEIVESADPQQLTTLYRRYYPLFQQAYVDLGYPDGYFNDRLIEVIDHLLATPDVTGPIRLTQPGMFFEYADPSLEERSAGQKLLIRMGPENARVVKDKLGALRKSIASGERTPAAP